MINHNLYNTTAVIQSKFKIITAKQPKYNVAAKQNV